MLVLKPSRVLYKLGKHSTIELYPWPQSWLLKGYNKTSSNYKGINESKTASNPLQSLPNSKANFKNQKQKHYNHNLRKKDIFRFCKQLMVCTQSFLQKCEFKSCEDFLHIILKVKLETKIPKEIKIYSTLPYPQQMQTRVLL